MLIFKTSVVDLPTLEVMRAEKNRLKSIVITKTVEVLKRLNGNLPAAMDSSSLSAEIKTIDWTKVTGVVQTDLEQEIAEYKKWEDLK